jgi:dTMP kinase
MGMLLNIEGIDGAGKGTLTRGLVALAEKAGKRVATLSFPRYDETRFAKLVGKYLDGEFGSIDDVPVKFAALLYAGDRHESRDELLSLLADNDLLILDRYVSSNIAYAAAKCVGREREEIIAWIRQVEYEIFELPKPDLTCLVSTDAALAQNLIGRKEARSYTNDSHDIHEADRKFLDRVSDVYHRLAVDEWESPWFLVQPQDQSGQLRPPAELQREVWQRIQLMLAA